jgi:hypothetical protein
MLVMLKVKAVPLHAKQAQRGGRGIALPIINFGARRGWVVSATPQLLYPLERDPVHILHVAGWASGLDLKNLDPTRVRTLDCPAGSESLY